jgi:hypothetical protein
VSTRIAVLAAAAAVALSAAPADARSLSPAAAERHARAALASQEIEAVRCVPLPDRRGRRRALCIVAHPAPSGQECRSFVELRTPKGKGRVRARVLRELVCLAEPGIEP